VILECIRAGLLALLAATALSVVRSREPSAQVVVVSFYGLLLSALFMALQAPDVALSQIVVGAVALPLMLVLALARIRKARARHEGADEREPS